MAIEIPALPPLTPITWRGRRISVLGGGRSGLSAARALQKLGNQVFLSDSGPLAPEALGELEAWGARWETGGHTEQVLVHGEVLVVSPGIPADHAIVLDAHKMGVPVVGELELGFQLTKTPIVAVTGSNGKTTTTTLLAELLQAAGMASYACGNIGAPLVDHAFLPARYLAVEVSSFQLETTHLFRPQIGMLLNVTPDHLDRHKTFEEYRDLKTRLFARQDGEDWAVLNLDDPQVAKLQPHLAARVFPISQERELEAGAFVAGGEIVVARRGRRAALLRVAELQQPGRHNVENALAAAAAATLAGVAPATIAGVLRTFPGVEHRLELVRRLRGVDYYNDSKGTNYAATVTALQSFDRPVVLILGGKDKGGDPAALLAAVRERAKAVLLIGEAAERFAGWLAAAGYEAVQRAADLPAAVAAAQALAAPDDVVLLSPACASYDMFRDYAERGRVFKSSVQALR